MDIRKKVGHGFLRENGLYTSTDVLSFPLDRLIECDREKRLLDQIESQDMATPNLSRHRSASFDVLPNFWT